MNSHPITLYMRDNTGNIRSWAIRVDDWDIVIEHGLIDGAKQEKVEVVPEGLAGRTRRQQIISRVKSRINKQVDKGYSRDIEDAAERPKNRLGMPKPMLAQPYSGQVLSDGVFVQYKYDGNRCLITKKDGKVYAYSRNGKLIESIDHILRAAKDIPEGTILDGELYHHGTSLQRIRSWISRKQPETRNLSYVCFDLVSPQGFSNRLRTLKNLTLGASITIAKSELIDSVKLGLELYYRLDRAILEHGYEGLIIRTGSAGYEDGKRSNSVLKVKRWKEREFEVLDVSVSKDGLPLLHLELGKPFKVTAPGGEYERQMVLDNPELYIDMMVTVKFACYTDENVPFHPVALAFREKHE